MNKDYLKRVVTLSLSTLLLIISNKSFAQVSLMGGANYCNVRDNNLLANKKGIGAFQGGAAIRVYPFKNLPNLSLENELLINRKGYQQDLDKNYTFYFDYFSWPLLVCYSPVRNFTVSAGVELSQLLFTNFKKGTSTYHDFDAGLVLGFSCFDEKWISLYSRMTYGLVPMLNYYSFDEMGNFTGEIHDLKNLCFSVGLKINLYHEKIHLYH